MTDAAIRAYHVGVNGAAPFSGVNGAPQMPKNISEMVKALGTNGSHSHFTPLPLPELKVHIT